MAEFDVVVVGSGPNGLAAAVVLAQAGRSVHVVEARETLGGGTRTAELTLPGFLHDVCSAVHPMAAASPLLKSLPLRDHGLELVHPDLPLAHPLDGPAGADPAAEDQGAAVLARDLGRTATGLGADGAAWRRLFAPLLDGWDGLLEEVLAPPHLPRRPLLLARFGLRALRSTAGLARGWFTAEPARALFAGIAAHVVLPLDRAASAAAGLVLAAAAHRVGWPIAVGGSRRISEALAALLAGLGGCIETGREVRRLGDAPPARRYLFDVTPRQLLSVAGAELPERYRRRLAAYRYGPGAFKLDWALSGPIPWRAPACRLAGTLHLGGTLGEIAAAEAAVWRGEHPERPFVLLSQPTLWDPSRAPEGRHTAWAYCHVPHGSDRDMTAAIEDQVERFAPGFRDLVLARHRYTAADLERYDPNYVGGDINGGVQDLPQILARPALRLVPYATPNPRIWICSSATPPGGGVHGMCGYHAAKAMLARG